MKLHKYWVPVLCLCVCLAAEAAQTKKLRVEAESAKIYIEPHKSSTVIGSVSKGTVLTLFDSGAAQKEKSWYYISFYSEEKWATITGFVEASLVSIVGGTPDKRSEEPPAPVQKQVPAKRPPQPPPKTTPPEKAEVKAKEAAVSAEKAEEKSAAAAEETARIQGDEVELVRCTGEVKVIGEKPAIRAAAADDGRILFVAQFEEVLELNGKKGDWYRVKYPRPDGIVLVGFVNEAQVEVLSSSLQTDKPAAVEPEPEPEAAPVAVKAAEEAKEADVQEPPVSEKTAPIEPPAPEQKSAGAEETLGVGVRPLSLALNAGYALPSESGSNGGFVLGGDLSYLVNRNLAVVLGFYRYQSQTEGSIEGLSKGKLTTMPLSLGIQGRFPVNERLFPYLAAGVAYHFNTFKLCQICQDNWDALGFDVREEVENGLGFQFGAGLDYEVTDYIDLNLDVRYQIAQGSGSWSQTDQFSGAAVSGDLEGLNFNALIIRVGAKIFLKII